MRVASVLRGSLPALLLVIALCPAAAFGRSDSSIIRAMNSVRAQHALPRLRANHRLARAADAHSATMARTRVMSHGAFERRLRRYVRSRVIGENLAWSNRCNARRVVQMWLASAPHRRIMLSRRFKRVGVARRASSGLCFVTADFASAR
jgi:uncharacterized protein YkwD